MFKLFLYIVISSFSLFYFMPCYAVTSVCTANSTKDGDYYSIPFSLHSTNTDPNAASNGEGLAMLTVDPLKITCTYNNTDFNFQLLPNSTEIENINGDHVCSIGTNGIGVIWYAHTGASIACNSWNDIFTIHVGSSDVTVNESGYIVGRVVRTNKPFDHYGNYSVQIPKMHVNLNRTGHNYGQWGVAKIDDLMNFTISGCVMDTLVRPIDFGEINIDSVKNVELARKNFNLLFTQCQDATDMNTFIDSVKLTFSSSTMASNGKIDNTACEGCASGVDIAILDEEGSVINLNEMLSMSKDSIRNGDTAFIYPFQAVLEKKTSVSAVGAGSVDASLVIKIEYF